MESADLAQLGSLPFALRLFSRLRQSLWLSFRHGVSLPAVVLVRESRTQPDRVAAHFDGLHPCEVHEIGTREGFATDSGFNQPCSSNRWSLYPPVAQHASPRTCLRRMVRRRFGFVRRLK